MHRAVATLLTGATVVTFEPALVERADLRIEHGRIVDRAPLLTPTTADVIVDLRHRLVLPGLVSAHHQPNALSLRGRVGARTGTDCAAFIDRIDAALSAEEAETIAWYVALEGLRNGVTSVVVAMAGGVDAKARLAGVQRAFTGVGLRLIAALELSPKLPADQLEASLNDVMRAATHHRQTTRFQAAVGLRHLDVLEDAWLQRAVQEAAPVVATLGLDPWEEKRCLERFAKTPTQRLMEVGLLTPNLIATPLVHLPWADVSLLLGAGSTLVHSPGSTLALQSGVAAAGKLGTRACFGTGAQPLDVLGAARVGWLKAREIEQPFDVARFIANGQRLAARLLQAPLGPLDVGAAADLVVLEDTAPTLTTQTLAEHLGSGALGQVESVMVDGTWRLWRRKALLAAPPPPIEPVLRKYDETEDVDIHDAGEDAPPDEDDGISITDG